MRAAARLVTVLAMAALGACTQGGGAPASGNAAAAAPAASNFAPAASNSAAAPAAAPSPALARIFTPDTLGANASYLESLTGPAFTTNGAVRTYKVGGCTVVAGINHGKIDNIGLANWGGPCVFPIAQYLATGGGPAIPGDPTFGDIQRSFADGRFSADCYATCGNAADPQVSFHYQGVHADNFNDLVASVPVRDDPVVTAYLDWTARLAAKYGQEAVNNGRFPGGDTLQQVAAKDFAALKPTTVRVGQNIVAGS